MHTKYKGNVGELICATEFAKLGYSVFKELGDISKLDVIAEKDGKLLRVQCKSATPKDGVLSLPLRKCGPKYVKFYDMSTIDYFSLYDLENNQLYLIPVEKLNKVGKCEFVLRLSPTKNGQSYESNWASDYLFNKVLI